MIINIPITIDEHIFEEKIQNDYDKVFNQVLIKYIEDYISSQGRYWGNNTVQDGMRELVNRKIDDYMKAYKDEIVDRAADILAKRIQRTKKAKEELINGTENNT